MMTTTDDGERRLDREVPQHLQAARYFPSRRQEPAPLHDRRAACRWRPFWPPLFCSPGRRFATFAAIDAMNGDVARMQRQVAQMEADVAAMRAADPPARRPARAPPGFLAAMLSGDANADQLAALMPAAETPRNPPPARRRSLMPGSTAMQAALVERAQRRDPPALSRDRPRDPHASASTRPSSCADQPGRMGGPLEPVAAGRQCRSALPRAVHHLARGSTSSSRASPPSPRPARSSDRSQLHQRLRRPLRSLPRPRRDACRHRSRRPARHPDLRHRRRHRRPLRME